MSMDLLILPSKHRAIGYRESGLHCQLLTESCEESAATVTPHTVTVHPNHSVKQIDMLLFKI